MQPRKDAPPYVTGRLTSSIDYRGDDRTDLECGTNGAHLSAERVDRELRLLRDWRRQRRRAALAQLAAALRDLRWALITSRGFWLLLAALVAILTLTGCAGPTEPAVSPSVAGTWSHAGDVAVELRLREGPTGVLTGCAAFMVRRNVRLIVRVEGVRDADRVELAAPDGWATGWTFAGRVLRHSIRGPSSSRLWPPEELVLVRDPLAGTWAESFGEGCGP